MYKLSILSAAGIVAFATAAQDVSIAAAVPTGAAVAQKNFSSYSIQFQQLPTFLGTGAAPNTYSVNLLTAAGNFTGTMPLIRVGGTTQDDVVWKSDLSSATTTNSYTDSGYKRPTVYIGPKFFDSFSAVPNTKYIFGLNLARNGTNPDGTNARQSLLSIADQACSKIGNSLHLLEFGNEPDLFPYWQRRSYSNWNAAVYVPQWRDGAKAIKGVSSCSRFSFFANSLTNPNGQSNFSPANAFIDQKQNQDGYVAEVSEHHYMGTTNPDNTNDPVTLEGTLLYHPDTVAAIKRHVDAKNSLSSLKIPYTIGEGNSAYGSSLSDNILDVFGAALWVVDFSLQAISKGISRMHFHQALNNPYNMWEPVADDAGNPHTNPTYYGNLFVNRVIGTEAGTQVTEITLGDSNYDAAYAAYVGGKLKRVALVNMRAYKAGASGRKIKTYNLVVGTTYKTALVERLSAPGEDSKTGVSFAGKAYEYSTQGKAATASNAPSNAVQTLTVTNGAVAIDTSDIEAVVVTLS